MKDSENGTKAEAEGCVNKIHSPTKPCHMFFADERIIKINLVSKRVINRSFL
jgi:hypothetical protein